MPPVVKPEPGQPVTFLDIMKVYRRTFTTYYPLGSTQINSCIPPITDARLQVVADLITVSASANGLDPLYLLSVSYQESCWSENTINHNLKATNPTPSFRTTDFGLCQFSGSFLSTKPGMAGLTENQMVAKVMMGEYSVPAMAQMYAANIKWATKTLASDNALLSLVIKLNITHLTNEQFLACTAYNKGNSGALDAIRKLDYSRLNHPFKCAQHYDNFCKALMGVTPGKSLALDEPLGEHEPR